ncbi:hypothetical protein R3W88_000196 [Solanum pinnatisectum]|uniref:DUF4283 domain-containing protein n=1 Tax=Solanum pinnatisectum TaxID=50273 RepID=A0AAV9MHB7_9SOLN|nr:hypothetical protein R3W88_000196 [Solanum pinnatisectum]
MARKSKTIGRGQQTQEINQVNRGMKGTVPQSGDAKKMKSVNVLQGIIPLELPKKPTSIAASCSSVGSLIWADMVEEEQGNIVMDGFFKRIWKGKGVNKVAQVNKGVFLVRFQSKEERDKVVEEGVIMFDRKPVVIRPWKADIDVTKEKVDKVPIWIRLVGLDIAGLVGIPLRADKATTNRERMTYARLLMEIPLNQEYPTCIMFENENGNIVEQRVEYEWKPVLCTKCKNFGYENSEYRRKENGEAGKRQGNQTTKMWGDQKKGDEAQRMEPATNQGVKSTNDHTSTSMTGKQANMCTRKNIVMEIPTPTHNSFMGLIVEEQGKVVERESDHGRNPGKERDGEGPIQNG